MCKDRSAQKFIKDNIVISIEIDDVPINPKEEYDCYSEEEYQAYLNGECYGVMIIELKTCECCKHVSEDVVESIWGFYGADFKRNGIYGIIEDFGYKLEEFKEV